MIVGIDLGTTNSLVAAWKDGQPQLLPNALGETVTPSVVGLSNQGTVIVGRAARERLVTHPHLTAACFKRSMGTERVFALGERSFRAEELSALVLKSLKIDAEVSLDRPITEAVISVPAYFNDTQRKATRIAGHLADLNVERLINEPTAAALAYGLHQTEESQFLVFDLGGGTFDVSVLELFEGIMEVRASAGDNYLGGEDFVDALVAMFAQQTGVDVERLPASQLSQLRRAAESAKRHLNAEDTAVITLGRGDERVECVIERGDYEARIEPLLSRIRRPVERAMRDARLQTGDLSEVVLVGGSTRKRIIQSVATQLFGRLPLRHVNPDEVVALGAAVQAGLKMRDAALDEVVMTDVCPYTLGVETAREMPKGTIVAGQFSPIIERNTVIPASRSDVFQPMREGQRSLKLEVYQGESRHTADNLLLGTLEIRLPKVPIEEAQVEVRFTYDVNGLLEVEATPLHTGKTHRLVIEQNPGSMSKPEIERRLAALAKLKVHPRDQLDNQTVLSRAKRLYEETLGAERVLLGELIDQFSFVLDAQDPRDIEREREQLRNQLNTLETDIF